MVLPIACQVYIAFCVYNTSHVSWKTPEIPSQYLQWRTEFNVVHEVLTNKLTHIWMKQHELTNHSALKNSGCIHHTYTRFKKIHNALLVHAKEALSVKIFDIARR